MKTKFNYSAVYGLLKITKYCVENHLYDDHDIESVFNKAAEKGHIDIVKYLKKIYKKINSFKAFSLACDNGHVDIVKLLYNRNYDEKLEYPLISAIKNGHISIVKLFINKCKPDIINDLAIEFVRFKHFEITRYIIENNKVDIHAHNDNLMYYAICCNNLEMIKYLHQKGSNLKARDDNEEEYTPFISIAAGNCDLNTVIYLHQNGCNLNIAHDRPIMYAINSDCLHMVKYLIENGVTITNDDIEMASSDIKNYILSDE